MRAEERFGEAAREALRREIAAAGGNEVFAVCSLDDSGMIASAEVVARGHTTAVNAVPAWLERGEVLVHNHPSGRLGPSDADLSIAGRAGEAGAGSYIVDNQVDAVYVVLEPILRRPRKGLNVAELLGAIAEDGALGRRMERYERRQAQEALLALVADSFNRDAVLAAEAGTGVGKSFAYLLPAMGWAALNDERVVISTGTINLQQQLFEKDIPQVAAAMRRPPKAVLLKGRNNYLCLRRLEDALRESALFQEESESLAAIAAWAESTETGERSDLPFLPDEGVWSRVCSEADLCPASRCAERDRCFYLRTRKAAAEARIIVANHHLLFADLAARDSGAGWEGAVVLPPYRRIVLDEAHNIESAATSFFSETFSQASVNRLLSRLLRRRRKHMSGALVRVAAFSAAEDALGPEEDAIQRLRTALEELNVAGLGLCEREGTYRLRGQRSEAKVMELLALLSELSKRTATLSGLCKRRIDALDEGAQEESAVWELKGLLRRLDALGAACSRFVEFDEHVDEIFWIERGRSAKGDPFARFTATPLDVAPKLRSALFDPAASVVCVSATLTVASSFAYWLGRSGLGPGGAPRLRDPGVGAAGALEPIGDKELLTGIFPSPFPYVSSVLLGAPTDAPLPDEASYRPFVDASVAELLRRSGGSALVLFTSYDALKSAYAASEPLAGELGLRLLRQGDDDRSRLLRAFLEDRSSVLFATDSFWEGIDAPGDTLRLVIIPRLPFRTPNDPVFEARREDLERRGGNAFMDLSLPEAVMRFRQGFGRLMRRGDDHGAVVVLDGRLLRKRYGSLFLQSLPETRRSFKPFAELAEDVERALGS